MRHVETVDVTELAPACPLLDCLRDWRGFAVLDAASEARATDRWLKLENQPDAQWEWSGGIPAVAIPPIGCYFLRDIEISGSGYLFSGERFVRERTHTSDVAMNRLNENYPGNPLDHPRGHRVTVDEPLLMITGAGNPTYGHWILDFLPRLMIAQQLLGPVLLELPILLPSDTPPWVPRMLEAYCGVGPDRLRFYSEQDDAILCRRLCLPSFGHNGSYSMHSIVRDFYGGLADTIQITRKRRICLSRASFSDGRVFAARETFERIAQSRGFDIVRPEELGFAQQAALYRSASCIVGEAGSGLHGSVFSELGTVVASVGFNWVQAHVSGAFDQRFIYLERLQAVREANQGLQAFTATDADLVSLFDEIDRIQV
ncbi:glycosyltransferase family 61 protein [Lichenicoccus roseus]|uniref:Glycosyltransferase family 61 protein n=1 Tax=Lichenicoccus roseus TaxID=2683649 RepID=A0A5R9J9H7_9PROT|nr:glycosyltransferase 61 family protein [Lichenicoccus roseus]TLU74250.1 glycosyltransferase family 61 protein [Lichenicoccus roseus]